MSKYYIRLRGLPWAATNEDILDFLKGVNVVNGAEGVYIVTSKYDGKNTGGAFVELESEQDVDEAFKHNKEMMGHRYIEIFNASEDEAQQAMEKSTTTSNSSVVKLRGLPYSIKEKDIEDFFEGIQIKPEGILIVTDRRGRTSGEAYVQFETSDDTEKALARNREKIGHRYIEIFRSSIAEMKRQSGKRPGPYDVRDRGGPRGGFGNDDFGRGRSRGFDNGYSNGRGFDDFDDDYDNSFGSRRRDNSNNIFGEDLYCVHMRGLPYFCFENHVNKFFEPLRPAKVNIIYNNRGLHSGSADALFETMEEAQMAMKKNKEQMGSRYIELFYDGKSKMNFNRRI